MAVKTVKTKKKKVSTLAEAMHGGHYSESPAVAYSRCLHRHPQCMSEAVNTEESRQTQSAAVNLR